MKRLFNNAGVTLIEVVIAAVIMGIIAVPLFDTLIETVKTNVKSDVALKMNAQMQKSIEDVKSTGKFDSISTYDKNFNMVPNGDPRSYYHIEVKSQKYNQINTEKNYDRWDILLEITPNGDFYNVEMFTNEGILDPKYNGLGKLFSKGLVKVSTLSREKLTLELRGKFISNNYACVVKHNSDTIDTEYFVLGYGNVVANGLVGSEVENKNKTIVINLVKMESGDNPENPFELNIENNTAYKGYPNQLSDPLEYKKVIVNVFNDNPSATKIHINQGSGQDLIVNRIDAPYSQLQNGEEIIAQVIDRDGNVVNQITNVVGKNITP